MRFTDLLALAAATAAITSPAGAQTDARVSIVAPSAAGGVYRIDRGESEHRAALGIGTSATGTLRDTLGLMITSVTKGSPAEKAGLEEGNRLAAINGVSLRANAADVEDGEMSGALTRRLTRELGKSKPGDEVELKVYRDGRNQTIRVKTADSDVLFARNDAVRLTRAELDNRAALGFSIGNTGSRRDTLGVLVMSVSDSTPAAKAGIEEGNRIASINGVNLRVAREDAGDRYLGSTKAQRLQREISALKPGDNVTLKVYSNGQVHDVTLKAARAGDLPRSGSMTWFGGDGFSGSMMPMPAMPAMPALPPSVRMMPMAPMAPMAPMPSMDGFRYEVSPRYQDMEDVRARLDEIRPQIDRALEQARTQVERSQERTRVQLERVRPQLERLRVDMPRVLQELRLTPRVRVVNVVV